MTDFVDQEITCADCKKPFVFEAGEQKFFAEKNFTPPKRCKPCRDLRKAQRDPMGRTGSEHADTGLTGSEYVEVWGGDADARQPRARKRSKGSRPRGDR